MHQTNGLEVMASGPSVVDVSRRNDSLLNYPPLGERINLKAVDPVTAIPVASEEEKLQTILRTLRKLPPDELDRLGVDLSEDVVVPGSERAMILLQAWEQRQEELREAMKALMKPAEFMGNLTQQLREKAILFADLVASSSETGKRSKEVREVTEEMNQLLIDLESLLTDVDNGRDFHSIGAWPTLVSFLSRTFPLSVRARAAWAMGSAMKNSYDYQLWTLEPLDLSLTLPSSLRSVESQSNVSALELLLHNFRQSANLFASLSPDDMFFVDALDFQKRSIYALSSALRGNIDVQDFIQLHHLDLFLDSLQSFLRTSSTEELQKKYQVTIIRKIFSLISDLLDERQYIRYDLSAAMRAQLFSTPAITTTTATTSTHQEVTGTISLSHNSNSSSSPSESGRRSEDDIESISSQLQRLQLLGDHLFAPQFGVGEGEGEVASDVTASVLRLIERYLAQLQTYKSESMESSVRNEWVCTHQTIEVGLTILSSFLRQHQLQHQQQLPAFLRLQQYSSLLLTLLEKLTQSPSITQNASYEDIVARGKELREAITPLLLR